MADYDAFLSYAHLDNTKGRITEFRTELEQLLTQYHGEPFRIFQDDKSLATGDLWEQKIEEGLANATIFIAILTPGFFKRAWCRTEIELFLKRHDASGREALIIPIYWLPTPLVEKETVVRDHPLASRIATRQFYNWTSLFGKPISSSEVQENLVVLVGQIMKQLEALSPPPAPSSPPPMPPPSVPLATPKVAPRTKPRIARLEVTNAPAGAALVVNGVAVAGLVYEVTLPTGTHEHAAEVVVSAPGFRTEEWDVVLVVDHPVALDATLDPLPVPRVVKRTGIKPAVYTAPLTLAEYKAQLQTIPGGSFERGGFTVTLSPFLMGRTPVTVGMWQEYAKAMLNGKMPELPDSPVWKDGWDAVQDHPIVNLSWEDCNTYANWAGLALPTEAQWEYASRGGLVGKVYPWGDKWDASKAWCSKKILGDSGSTAPVVRSQQVFVNDYGLVDMSGNVWEWCADWYGDYEQGNPTNPTGVPSGEARILRGGSWINGNGIDFRCAYRYGGNPAKGNINWGFRLVLNG